VVDTGVEFADKYEMPSYVAKVRESSKLIDVASEKIETFYCEKGASILDKVDQLTAMKINAALEVANDKVELAKKLKTDAACKVTEKKMMAIQMTEQTKAQGIAKYNTLKIEASKKVDESKTIMRKRFNDVSERAMQYEEKLENKLKETEYGNKVLSVVITAKKQVVMYGEAFVKKSLSLPLTLQERWESGLSIAKEQAQIGTKAFQAQKAEFVSFTMMKYEKMTSANALKAARSVFGDKAVMKAEDMLKELKKAQGSTSVQAKAKMKTMYAYSTEQVGYFAKIAEEMEGKYFGTTVVFRARAKFTGK
jgi:hypothetical protein